MSRTEKFLINSIAKFLLLFGTMIAGLVIPQLMIKVYGSEVNGLISSINQFITTFLLVEAGLASAGIFALYKPLAEGNAKEVNSILTAVKRCYLTSGIYFSALVAILAVVFPWFVRTDVIRPYQVGLLVLILGVTGIVDFFAMSKYRVLLTADQREFVISFASLAAVILNTIIIAALAHFRTNIIVMRGLAILSILPRSLILFLYARARYHTLNFQEIPNFTALNRRWDALYLQILGAVQLSAPIFLATIFTDLKTVSVYSVFSMVVGSIQNLLAIFITGLPASFGDILVRGQKEGVKTAYQDFEFGYYSILAVVYSITLVMLMPFIRLYTAGVTDANYDLPLIGLLVVINSLLYNLKTPQGMMVIAAGMFRETRVQTTIQGLIAVIVGLILAPKWGLSGILVGSIFSNLYRVVDLLIFIPKNVTGLKISQSLFRQLRVIALFSITQAPFVFIKLNPINYLQWAKDSLFVALYVIFAVFVVSYLFDKETLKNILKRIYSMSVFQKSRLKLV